MEIVIGSFNKAKVKAVTAVFPSANISSIAVASDVSAQPIGDMETRKGALNRANNAKKQYPEAMTIGLEGGVMFLHHQLYLNNWGALITPNGTIFTAAGVRIPLPNSFIEQINSGVELSDIMNEYTKRNDIRHHEGAIGIFTNLHLTRADMFQQIVMLLKGQMEYAELK